MATGRHTQGALTVVTELTGVALAGVDAALRDAREQLKAAFEELPRLHFARLAILDETRAGDHLLPPCLVLATIHDGEREAHLGELAGMDALRALYATCGVEDQLAAHLSAHALEPLCFYNAHPGLSRDLIVAASHQRNLLHQKVQELLTATSPQVPTVDALSDHARQPPPSAEQRALFAAAKVTRYSIPVRELRRVAFGAAAFVLVVVVPVLLGLGLTRLALHLWPRIVASLPLGWPWVAVLVTLAILVAALAWLRWRERADERGDERDADGRAPMPAAVSFIRSERPRLAAADDAVAQHLRRVADEEDVNPEDAHNHLTHCAVIKRGVARPLLLRLVFAIVNARAFLLDREGKLGGIPSIHFARWVLIDRGKPRRRLLFLSDYDGTWESYLGQFVDLAALGLTGVWSNAERFPRAWLLFGAGARAEQRFKLWTRLRQVETPFVYSHYPQLSVHAVRADVDFCKAWATGHRDSREAASMLKLLQSHSEAE